MKDELKNKLSGVFAERQKREAAAAKATEVRQSKEDEFLQAFMKATDDIIFPAMEEIGVMMRANGYQYSIDRTSETLGHRASIRLNILTDVDRSNHNQTFPFFEVYCNKGDQKFQFMESTIVPNRGGHRGGCGEATLETLTFDLLQQKITKTINDIVLGGGAS